MYYFRFLLMIQKKIEQNFKKLIVKGTPEKKRETTVVINILT